MPYPHAMQTITISAEDDDIRLDRWFKRHYPQLTQGELQKMLRKKLIKLDGKKTEANQRLSTGQQLKFPELSTATQPSKPTLHANDVAMIQQAVIYKDEHLIAINKPAGLASQGGSGQKKHVDRLLPALQFDAAQPPKLVHRLDKDTSGVLLLARTPQSATLLTKAFKQKTLTKNQPPVLGGVPPPPRDFFVEPLPGCLSTNPLGVRFTPWVLQNP